ncbi:PA14 domain-containing protein [Sorangium sp. So ce315]|uniref:PA14 domain-containing protein n=1 Tax=Sorangium sp. So ce315 TaxID=3133299 RepID=UPI003F5FA464
MSRFLVFWKATPVVVKATAVCLAVVALGAVVLVGRCAVTQTEAQAPQAGPVLVSGAVVTIDAVPAAPPGVVVIGQATDFGGPRTAGVNALRGLVYFVPSGTSHLLNTASLSPVAVLYTPRLDISPRSWESGFPGVPGGRNEWFQIAYEGELVTSRGGAHQFELLSDDGSRLFIDDHLVIENDGRHPPASAQGAVVLQPGKHRIRVSYFQGPRFEIALQLFVTPPQGARQILDISRVL